MLRGAFPPMVYCRILLDWEDVISHIMCDQSKITNVCIIPQERENSQVPVFAFRLYDLNLG